MFENANNAVNLNALAIFVAVAEQQSFSAGAASLVIAKSTASQRVKDLEAELGVQLLVRTTRSFRLTEAGEALYERGREIVGAAAEAEQVVSRISESPIGTLRVSAPVSFGRTVIGDVVSRLLETHPELSVHLDLEDRDVDLISEHYDVAVRVGELPASGLSARRVGTARWSVVAAPSYLSKHGAPESPADLPSHQCLLFAHRRVPGVWAFSRADGQREDIRVVGRFVSNHGDVLAERAAAGAGLAWLPDFITRERVAAGALVPVLETFCDTEAPIHLLFPERRHRPLKVQLFADAVQQALAP